MNLLKLLIVLIIVINVNCYIHTSELLMDKLYGKDQSNGKSLSELKFSIKSRLNKAVNKLIASLKSPKGFKSSAICVWKICSKPLQKTEQKVNSKETSINSRRIVGDKAGWFQKPHPKQVRPIDWSLQTCFRKIFILFYLFDKY